jgi:probable O-glycosylation ligase (exosortase A-associated)
MPWIADPPATRGASDSVRAFLRRYLGLRTVVVAGVLLTYVWRFHDLSLGLKPFRLAAIFTVASWAFLFFAPRWSLLKEGLSRPYIWLFLLWSTWMFLGIPFALSPTRASEALVQDHLKNVTMVLFLLSFFRTVRHVRFAAAVQVFGAAVLTFFYIKGGFRQWGSPVPMYDRNDFALILVVAAPLALFLGLTTKEKWEKIGAWALILGIGASVLRGGSRGGFLALSVAALFLFLRLKGIKLWVRVVPPILLVLGVMFAPPEVRDRLRTLLTIEEDYNYTSEIGRKEVWKRGIGYMLSHPVFGIGRANFPVAEGTLAPRARAGDPTWTRRSVAHSVFVEVGAETGVVGGILYVAMILSAFWSLAQVRRRFSRGTDPYSRMVRQFSDCLSASMIGFVVAGVFLSLGYASVFFSLLCIIAGFEVVTSRVPLIQPAPEFTPQVPASLQMRQNHAWQKG